MLAIALFVAGVSFHIGIDSKKMPSVGGIVRDLPIETQNQLSAAKGAARICACVLLLRSSVFVM